jgi:carbon-monoxide dehydrogenase large subunit
LRERYQGQSLNRLEDHRFLTGRGTYVANDHVADVLHAHVVRSPHAFARITRIGLDAAQALPGVVAVLSEADLAADGIGDLPCVTVIDAVEPIIAPPRPALARGVVRHVGDPVVLIVAETLEAAVAAGEAVDITYEPLPCVTAATAALKPPSCLGRGMPRLLQRRWRRLHMSSNATYTTTGWWRLRWRRARRSAFMIARPISFCCR